MKALRWAAITVAVLLVVIQAIRPARTNPPVDESRTLQANTQMTQDVQALLERSCNDCHSSKTRWPWYSHVAPVSWFVIHHVNEGREEFSLSEWAQYNPRRAAHKLEEMYELVEKGEMPLTSYLLLHPEAKLSEADKKVLIDWARGEHERLAAALPDSLR